MAQQQQESKAAETTKESKGKEAKGGRELERSQGRLPARWSASSPLAMMRRLREDMDRMFGGFGSSLFRWPEERWGLEESFWPELEVSQKGNKFVVRADVPGLKKDDINVEVRDDELCISGERKSEWEQKEGEYYRSERSYGSFCRTVTLPEGAKPETASASFENGVLTIEFDVPEAEQKRARRIEVREGKREKELH